MATAMTSCIDHEQLAVHQTEKQYPHQKEHKSKSAKTTMTSCIDHIKQAIQQIE